MGKLSLKDFLTITLKATKDALAQHPALKFAGTFVTELSSKWRGLPEEQRGELADVSHSELATALKQLDFATQCAENAADGALRTEAIVEELRTELRQQAEQHADFRAFADKFQDAIPEIQASLERIEAKLDVSLLNDQTLLAEIRRLRVELQEALDHRRAAEQLARGVERVAGGAELSEDPAVARLGERLGELLEEYDQRVMAGAPSLDVADADDLAIARATRANAAQRFDETLAIVTADDERNATQRAVDVLKVRADAFYGNGRWNEALSRYSRIVELCPERVADINLLGNCLWRLRRFAEALEVHTKLVDLTRRVVRHEGRFELEDDLAASLVNRGVATNDLGQHGEAIKDFDEAIEILSRLVAHDRGDLCDNLASAYSNRGAARSCLGSHVDALRDLNQATRLRRSMCISDPTIQCRATLANSHNNRGAVYCQLGMWVRGLVNFNKAIAIRRQLIESDGREDAYPPLASNLKNRAKVWKAMGAADKALTDLAESERIYAELVGRGRDELAIDLEEVHVARQALEA